MKILNIGSLNIDKVYSVDHFVQAGETLTAPHAETFSGGKGLNQSVALARAGAEVYAAGAVGPDGLFLKALLEQSGADTRYLQVMEGEVTGHAIIQLVPSGQNSIIISAGANGALTETYIDDTLSHFGPGDLLLLQNETSNVPYAMKKAKELGLKVAFNASPITAQIFEYPLELVDYFIINEIEGQAIAGCEETGHKAILAALAARFPKAVIVLTLGKDGVLYHSGEEEAPRGVRLHRGGYHRRRRYLLRLFPGLCCQRSARRRGAADGQPCQRPGHRGQGSGQLHPRLGRGGAIRRRKVSLAKRGSLQMQNPYLGH